MLRWGIFDRINRMFRMVEVARELNAQTILYILSILSEISSFFCEFRCVYPGQRPV